MSTTPTNSALWHGIGRERIPWYFNSVSPGTILRGAFRSNAIQP